MLGSLLATHRLQVARTPAPLPPARPADEFHVVFSTDCGKYQDWQSEVVYHSATLAGQPGRVTRIASGCTDAEAAKLRARHAEPDLAGRFLVHLTPHFSTDGDSGKDYKFYNKPYGLRHWLGAGRERRTLLRPRHWLARVDLGDDAVVALIDPDFIFLRPLTADVSNASAILASAPVGAAAAERFRRVKRGQPVGQFYCLGDGWLKFDLGKICGAKSRCANVTSAEAWRYYSVGPPYIAHRDDLAKIADRWCEYVPRVFAQYPELLAEMYAYSMAAADLGLPHLRLDHYMVSNVNAWIDGAATSSCDVTLPQRLWPGHDVPVFVHYCQGYRFAPSGAPRRGACRTTLELRGRAAPAAVARGVRAGPRRPPGRPCRRPAGPGPAGPQARVDVLRGDGRARAVVAKYGLGRRTRPDGACD
ncbi:hypothetical protein JL721_6714 [Aureococcus anophagefferens]|nr:hypothetical protein JL721_6714 [Aureococcus anophagefferens]